ncbi:MAG: hypothetical protein ACRESZ_21175 [Methylococcales bacterium]
MMNALKKKTLNVAIGAALGVAVTVPASADSLLAPLVVSTGNIQTYFQLKVQGDPGPTGKGIADARWSTSSDLHYYWFQRGVQVSDLRLNPAGWSPFRVSRAGLGCEKTDVRGVVSPWDMVFQSLTVAPPLGPINPPTPVDQSVAQFVSGPFVGFMILDDEVAGVSVGFDPANPNPNKPHQSQEGQFSGSAYVVDFVQNIVLDYKLLNNHNSAESGNFAAGFISKKVVDFQWWPENQFFTEWLVLAVGRGMTQDISGIPSSDISWPGRVQIRQDLPAFPGGPSARTPFGGQQGVYNNDERVFSGTRNPTIDCMALIDRSSIMPENPWVNTVHGGWTRKNLTPVLDSSGGISANGAIVYRFETGIAQYGPQPQTVGYPGYPNVFGANTVPTNTFRSAPVNVTSFQVESSGHLQNGERPNRPY